MGNEQMTKEVTTTEGLWVIKKPKAGVRNRAMMKAETDTGGIRHMVLITELLPQCILRRPDSIDDTVPIENILDSLEMEDYDKLSVALASMIMEEPDEKSANEQVKV